MSAERIESRDSRVAKGTKVLEKPPFKLCFSKNQRLGRSDVLVSKTAADVLTPKFYSREMEGKAAAVETTNTAERLAREEGKGPTMLYRWPLLSSHAYGWWHRRGIRPNDERLDFRKKTSDLVTFRMKIYAEDKKAKGSTKGSAS
ncbi:hypothetical protein KM043_001515 [Ampulex compressa]|nr:hypothetical protein KM043_001515 [Ampulex compressa]